MRSDGRPGNEARCLGNGLVTSAASPLVETAIALHREGRLKDAVALYQKALQGEASPAPALMHFAGMAWLGLGRPRKAEFLLGQAAAGSRRADFHVGHGNALYGLKHFAKAQKAFAAAAALDPTNATVWFNLGNAASSAHDTDAAIHAFEQALEYDPLLTQALVNLSTLLACDKHLDRFAALLRRVQSLGIWRGLLSDIALIGIPAAAKAGDKGRVVEDALREIAGAAEINPQALCLLGNLLFMRKDFAGAEVCYAKVIEVDPEQPGAGRGLGLLLAARGETEAARKHLAAARASDPDAEQLRKLSNLLIRITDSSPDHIKSYGLIRELYPDSVTVFETHLTWLTDTKDWKGIVDLLEERVQTHESPEYLVVLGAALMNLKREAEALKHLRRSIKLAPKNFAGWYNLSNILTNQGNNVDAYKAGKKAFLLEPKRVEAATSLALIAGRLRLHEEEERIVKRGLRHSPDSAPLLNLMGNNRLRQGNMKAALKLYERARAHIGPTDGAQFQMQLMSINYADVAPEIVSDAHFRWGDAVVAAWQGKAGLSPRPAAPKTRLKIGYVSGDYKNHSCSFFLAPLMANHDPERVEVYCYMTEVAADEVNLSFRRMARHWREIHHVTDTDAAAMIRRDGIDVLVDLSGHTSGARLEIFAQKPAPIQVNWLGYPNTTGLPTMDYRFTDAAADPVGMTDRYFRETLYRLPNFLCYQPPEFTPEVGKLPALAKGYVTFGCFNNSNKITDEVVAVWSRIMKRVSGSHMVLKTSNMSDKTTLGAFRAKFEKNGIDPGRIECFQAFPNKSDHLMTYSDIDLALDPFPYNGTTTTFESLWMGVPMIALEGKVHAGRVGHSILSGVGLPELVGRSPVEYVDIAVALAADLPRMEAYRSRLRRTLASSPLMDGKGFARSMEDAYFDMWNHAVATSQSVNRAQGQSAGAKKQRI